MSIRQSHLSPLTPRPVTFVVSPRLDQRLGASVTIASEAFQYTGSFKFRGALNTVICTDAPHLITASSGNFGLALAFACRLYAKHCTVVMPHDALKGKIEGVHAYDATVDLVDTSAQLSAERVAELLEMFPCAVPVHPSDSEQVLLGNETLGAEILAHDPPFDAIVAPIGGGGLVVGLIRAARRTGVRANIIGVEPRAANDVAQSLRAGKPIRLDVEPITLADETRAPCISEVNWAVIRSGCGDVFEVEESRIAEATRLLFTDMNLIAEPSGALSLAAVIQERDWFQGQRVCCVVTGGNVDPDLYSRILKNGFWAETRAASY